MLEAQIALGFTSAALALNHLNRSFNEPRGQELFAATRCLWPPGQTIPQFLSTLKGKVSVRRF